MQKVVFLFTLLPTFSYQHLTEDFQVTQRKPKNSLLSPKLFISSKQGSRSPFELAGMLKTT